MNPLITVIIPTYNHAHFLGRAIKSVLDQTYTNWEIIVIDNHSTDNTDNLIKSFNQSRIKLLKIHNDGVIGMSRNKGILNANGEWIAFLDSDDFWYPGKLKIIMNEAFADKGYDVFSTNELMVDSKKGISHVLNHGPYEENFYAALLIKGNRLSPSATVVRNEFLKNYNILFNESKEFIAVEDYDFWLQLAIKNAKFYFIDNIQGEFLIHESNNSGQLLRYRKNLEHLLRKHVFKVQKFNAEPEKLWKQLVPRLHVEKVRQLYNEGKILDVMKTIFRLIFFNPIGVIKIIYFKLKHVI